MTELLQVPSLRFIEFHAFCVTNALCQVMAKALKEGSVVTITLPRGRGSGKVVSALKWNSTLTNVRIYGSVSVRISEAFYHAM
jgi:hypothetical protein